jgi:hypothetical protein
LALAELLMFSFDRPDSSMQLFLQVVESKPDSAMTARALYSIGYIMYAIKKDTVHADSLFRGLVYLYPGSAHAEGARRILGWPLLSDKVDTASFIYHDAEKAYWEEKDLTKALKLYKSIAEEYPRSPFAIKAEYGKGWLYEHDLHNYDMAIETYKYIVEKYPESVYGKDLKNKLTRHEQAIQAIEARKKAVADSIKMAAEKAKAAADSLKQTAPRDSTAAAATAPDSAAAIKAVTDSASAGRAEAAPPGAEAPLEPELKQKKADRPDGTPPDAKALIDADLEVEKAREEKMEKSAEPAPPDKQGQPAPGKKKPKETQHPKIQE